MGSKPDKALLKQKDLFGDSKRSTKLTPINRKAEKNWRAKYDEDIDDDDDFEDDDFDDTDDSDDSDEDFDLDNDLTDPSFDDDDDDDDDEYYDDSSY